MRLLPSSNPTVSFIMQCGHDRVVLSESLSRIERCGLQRCDFEVLLLGQSSPQPRDHFLQEQFPLIHMVDQAHSPAFDSFARAVGASRGRYVVLLEDDSHPRPGAVLRMMMHFESQPDLAAAIFTITRPDGTRQHAAYPNLIVPCGTGLRLSMLKSVALPDRLDNAAGVYDLSLKLLSAGHEIRTFDDLHATHADIERRDADRAFRADVHDGLLLYARHFPRRWVLPFARDWLRRQRLLAASTGRRRAYYKGLLAGLGRAMNPLRRQAMDDRAFQSLVQLDRIRNGMASLARRERIGRIVLLDVSPNLLSYYVGARDANVEVAAIADPVVTAGRRAYRGVPILGDHQAAGLAFDAAVLTCGSAAQTAHRLRQWRAVDSRPVYDPAGNLDRGSIIFGLGPSGSRQTAVRSA